MFRRNRLAVVVGSLVLVALATTYFRQERFEEVEPLFRRILFSLEESLGPDHPWTIQALGILGSVNYRLGRFEVGERMSLAAIERARRILGEGHPQTRFQISRAVDLYEAWDQPEKVAEFVALLGESSGDPSGSVP